MARTDAVQFFLELAAEWRRLGAEVTFEPDWERRGNGMMPAYDGGVVHHTAFLSSFAHPFPAKGTLLNGRPDLGGPLCNVAGPVCPIDRPRLHIMAAFPANHAGGSGGRSMGPLPITGLFNRVVVGLEVDYGGVVPMIGGQYRAALIFTRGLANVLKRSVEWIRAHAETSITGKWDPGYAPGKTYDMAAFRQAAAAIEEDDDMPLTPVDEALIKEYGSLTEAVARRVTANVATAANPWGLDALLGRIVSLQTELIRLKAALATADANDAPAAMAQEMAPLLVPLLVPPLAAAFKAQSLAEGVEISEERFAEISEQMLREVLGSLDEPTAP